MGQIAKALARAKYLEPVADALSVISKAKKYDELISGFAQKLLDTESRIRNVMQDYMSPTPQVEPVTDIRNIQKLALRSVINPNQALEPAPPVVSPPPSASTESQTSGTKQQIATQKGEQGRTSGSGTQPQEQLTNIYSDYTQRTINYKKAVDEARQMILNLQKELTSVLADPNLEQNTRTALAGLLENAIKGYENIIQTYQPSLSTTNVPYGGLTQYYSGEELKSLYTPNLNNTIREVKRIDENTGKEYSDYYLLTFDETGNVKDKKLLFSTLTGLPPTPTDNTQKVFEQYQKNYLEAKTKLDEILQNVNANYPYSHMDINIGQNEKGEDYFEIRMNPSASLSSGIEEKIEPDAIETKYFDEIAGQQKVVKGFANAYNKSLNLFKTQFDNTVFLTPQGNILPLSRMQFALADTKTGRIYKFNNIFEDRFKDYYLLKEIRNELERIKNDKQRKSNRISLDQFADNIANRIAGSMENSYGFVEIDPDTRNYIKRYIMFELLYNYADKKQKFINKADLSKLEANK